MHRPARRPGGEASASVRHIGDGETGSFLLTGEPQPERLSQSLSSSQCLPCLQGGRKNPSTDPDLQLLSLEFPGTARICSRFYSDRKSTRLNSSHVAISSAVSRWKTTLRRRPEHS